MTTIAAALMCFLYSSCFSTYAGTAGTGIANSIGASSLAILLSLGFPWLLVTLIDEFNPEAETTYFSIQSNGFEYTILALIPAIAVVFFTFWACKFVLKKRTGLMLFLVYLGILSFAILVELDVLFEPNYCD